jgi:CheY-like chemotaxis protein
MTRSFSPLLAASSEDSAGSAAHDSYDERWLLEVPRKMRHDLRTPINQIIGYGEMLQEEAQEEGLDSFSDDLGKILLAARRMNELVDEVFECRVDEHAKSETSYLRIRAENAALEPESGLVEVTSETRTLQVPVADEAHPVEKGHLLVVDDNEMNRDMLCRRLERQGHATGAAKDGKQALDMVRAGKFDLILLDILMPEMNGYEVLHALKTDEHLRDIPVIMISALGEMDSVVKCITMGAVDYLPKPFDPVLLRARIGACLEKKRLRDKELEYLEQVGVLTGAAQSLEAGEFDPSALAEVAGREDALGHLARVFIRTGEEVKAREQRLKKQVTQLRIEIDQAKKQKQVNEVTSSEYFQDLQKKVQNLREKFKK